MVTALEALRIAREVLLDEEKWTQRGFFAYDADGKRTYGYSQNASCFCALGALQLACCAIVDDVRLVQGPWVHCVQALERAVPEEATGIATYNDAPGRTHAEIIQLYDRAIAELEAA